MPSIPKYLAPALAALMVAACAAPRAGGTLTVFAAASLTESFGALAEAFGAHEPGIAVRASYAGSSTLVAQIRQGAPADVFASADEANMRTLTDAGLAGGEPAVFATNRLEIVVRAGNPKGIAGLADLARPDVVTVVAAPSVPAGAYAALAFAKAGVTPAPRSLETDVRQVVHKVALGEADAGVVYRTDVRAAGARVEGVAIPDAYNVVARYPIAVVSGGTNTGAARAFVSFVRSDDGLRILARYGFLPPS